MNLLSNLYREWFITISIGRVQCVYGAGMVLLRENAQHI